MTARLFLLDYKRTLRDRKTWLSLGMLVYAVLSMPLVVARPPAHVAEALELWFGNVSPFSMFMFVWIDLAMNKVIAFLPVVLASGILLTERDTGVLAVLAAKPLGLPRYFVLRATSACLVMFTLHLVTHALGLLWFPSRIDGFDRAVFSLAMALHAFAAVFATALTATIAVMVRRRLGSALVGLGVLATLVGLALIGFYQPAWRTVSYLNPITLGSLSVGKLETLNVRFILVPIVALVALTSLTLWIGAGFARRMEEQS